MGEGGISVTNELKLPLTRQVRYTRVWVCGWACQHSPTTHFSLSFIFHIWNPCKHTLKTTHTHTHSRRLEQHTFFFLFGMKVARSSYKTLVRTYLLSRARAFTQACDVIMMEKFMLVGSAAQEWRKQICPSLTSKRIHRLMSHFTPNASAPEAVEPEVMKHLLLEVILCVCDTVCAMLFPPSSLLRMTLLLTL